jgi:hypothetical protein
MSIAAVKQRYSQRHNPTLTLSPTGRRREDIGDRANRHPGGKPNAHSEGCPCDELAAHNGGRNHSACLREGSREPHCERWVPMPNVHGLRELMESRAVFHLFAKVPQRG